MSSGMPPAIVSAAAPTITRGSILRYLSRSGSSTHEASGSPSWIGTAAPPVPTVTLAIRSGCASAANRAAEVPTSGATMCGVPRSASVMSRARNSPIARGDSRSSRRSDAPKPGRSTANRRACPDSVSHIGANAYTLSGQGLVSRTTDSREPPLSAYRIRTPSTLRKRTCGVIVAGMQHILQVRAVLHTRRPPGQVPGHPSRRQPTSVGKCRSRARPGRERHRAKLVLNNWLADLTETTAETLSFARELGLDPAAIVDLLESTPLGSPYATQKA